VKLFDLTGKVALVTGGNRGIGFGMAEGLAQAGADVVIWGTDEAQNKDAEARLKAHGVRVLAQRVEITDEQAVIAATAEAIEAMGRLDTAIANAGIVGEIKPFVDYTFDDWRKVQKINVDGAFFTLREACRHMVQRAKDGDPGGSLVGISSIGAIHGSGRTPSYGASKGAMLSLIRAIAVENARWGVRANCIHPGFINTRLTPVGDPKYDGLLKRVPMRRYGEVEDFAGIAIYLASDASRFHTADSIVIDGGYTVF
jgi:NAD(P)-dependent dehydrogenase (short-subunit alcohol dehydrogenase family)